MKSLSYLNRYFLKYKFQILTGCLFILLANVFALFPAQLIGKSFDLIIEKIHLISIDSEPHLKSLYYTLFTYCFLLIFVALLKGVFMFYMRQYIIVVSRNIEYDLKNEIYQKYQNLSFSFYQNHDSGDLLSRITEDVNKVRMYLGPAVMYSANLIILIILIVSRMLTLSPVLTSIVLIPLPILSFLIYKVSHRINAKSNLVQQKLSSLTNLSQEVFLGIRLIKSFVREKEMVASFNQSSEEYMRENIALARINSVFFPLVLLLVGISILLVVYVGGLLVVQGLISVGEIAEFIIYVNMLTWPVTSVGWVTEVVQRASASQSRINEFLQHQDLSIFSKSTIINKQFRPLDGNIKFVKLSFAYPNDSLLALNEINIEIPNNKMIAFVGHVGSGKTTILQLLSGLLQPNKEQLQFNNIFFELLNWRDFRKHMSYVSQDVFLFSDSIRNNILFGNDDISDEELFKLCDALCLLKEISSFNEGFDTYVGEGGVTLSGGQKQRVALARALIKKPKYLILDDALSSVDSTTEMSILNHITNLSEKITIILTSNRLSVINRCAKVFVLKKGAIVQEGKPNELINLEGEFKKIFINQLRSS